MFSKRHVVRNNVGELVSREPVRLYKNASSKGLDTTMLCCKRSFIEKVVKRPNVNQISLVLF